MSPDKLIHIQVTPQTTGATVSYQVPSGDACAVIVSDSPAFDTVVETFTDTATPPDMPRTAQLGATAALLANRSYYLRLLCGAYAQTSEFRLRPASRGR